MSIEQELSARRFVLNRTEDATGTSGLGIVAEGVEFSDGSVAPPPPPPQPEPAPKVVAAMDLVDSEGGEA